MTFSVSFAVRALLVETGTYGDFDNVEDEVEGVDNALSAVLNIHLDFCKT